MGSNGSSSSNGKKNNVPKEKQSSWTTPREALSIDPNDFALDPDKMCEADKLRMSTWKSKSYPGGYEPGSMPGMVNNRSVSWEGTGYGNVENLGKSGNLGTQYLFLTTRHLN
ncbi:hypothetical protein [Salidesulfovibrio onnuriiensis]|uniref:hypothetical protein n=1 Tax=Salidesulfovibrio onnuriiensis TaxID=2583823 RepID=UPI0011C8FC84|nr:hypothetical protein [Salidesulfovibrio onnuriiensis]